MSCAKIKTNDNNNDAPPTNKLDTTTNKSELSILNLNENDQNQPSSGDARRQDEIHNLNKHESISGTLHDSIFDNITNEQHGESLKVHQSVTSYALPDKSGEENSRTRATNDDNQLNFSNLKEAILFMGHTLYPDWLRLAMKKSILSLLVTYFSIATLFIVVQFYTIYIYLTAHKLTFHQLSLAFLITCIVRFALGPSIYYLTHTCKHSKWCKAEGRQIIIIFGIICFAAFILIFHPWRHDFGLIQLSLSLVFFEIGIENISSELSRVFHIQHFFGGISKHLNILEEVVFIASSFVIFFMQVSSGNVADINVFEIECLFVAILCVGCLLFSAFFFPGHSQLKICQGGKQLVSNVSEIHRSMTHCITRVLSYNNFDNDADRREHNDNRASLPFINDKILAQLHRITSNPHFIWPLIARCARQTRISFNTTFLFLFVKLFFVTAKDFSENNMGIDIYILSCLILHTAFIKVLWKTVKDSGAVVLNTILTTISVGCGVLMLILGRKYHFLAACYFLAENVLSRCGVQLSYSMFQTNFQVFDRKYNPTKKPISRKKIAHLNVCLSNCAEYLVLALMTLIGSSHMKDFMNFDNSTPFAERCEIQQVHNFNYSKENVLNAIINPAHNSLNKIGKVENPPSLLLRSQREFAENLTSNNVKQSETTNFEQDNSNLQINTNAELSLFNNNENNDQEPSLIINQLKKSFIVDEVTEKSIQSKSKKLPYHQCEDLLDVTFLIAVSFSLVTSGVELLAMRRYRRNFPTHSSNVVL